MPRLGPVTKDTHPLLRQRGFAIESPPLQEFVEHFELGIQVGELSLCAYGEPRTGKTTAGQFLSRRVEEEGVAVVASALIERQQHPKNIDKKEFWDGFLPPGKRKSYLSPGRTHLDLINYLAVRADKANNDRLVLICDEAQNLVVQHLAMLKMLVDELIKEQFTPFVLLLAQPDVTNLIEQLEKQRLVDLLDRFFTQMHRFRGLTPPEIRGVLTEYDVLDYPQGSGVSFTQYFASELFHRGWRLENEAPTFEGAFRAVHEKFRLGPFRELRMKYLTAAVRCLLTTLKAGDSKTPSELVPDCVRRSGIIEAQRVASGENLHA